MAKRSENPSRAALYMRTYRENPEKRKQNQLSIEARRRAFERLAEKYPDQARELVDEERVRCGLRPVAEVLIGRPSKSAADA